MLVLLAQKGAQAGDAGGALAGLGMMICCPLVIVLAFVAVEVMFLLAVSKLLKAISPRNRKMEPGQVWFMFIPFFNIVWWFIMVIRVSESLELEYEERGIRPDGDFGKIIGFITFFFSPLIILYWMKIAGYRKQLTGGGQDLGDEDDRPRRRRDEDEGDDDEPRRRRDDADDDEDDRPRRRR